ncbi:hypothetical protein Snoj_10430 [Streptomyces nojiriensis]|uniref:Uncharacterized protein n=1 Tax=Streptomyces nojiriensis TaxID=66374 RepID=A0ABQ3SGV0_9ACTN|nr:hypothetical protein GCM10010205_67290 [Streptomyces nojiriensis]GHI67125.1 hypothetical protein Snoj_10430 [Streptomyces nojiriensis]
MSDRLVIPGIEAFTREGLPAPAQTDDRNPWVDGVCWLYCGQRWTRVLWIGPASVAGMQAPMFACGPCIAELHQRVWRSLRISDEPDRPSAHARHLEQDEHGSPRGGRHRARSRFLRS